MSSTPSTAHAVATPVDEQVADSTPTRQTYRDERRSDPGRRLRQQPAPVRGLADLRLTKDEIDMHSVPTSDPARPVCPEPGCGLPAERATTRDLDTYQHELTGTCKRGHLWATKWFADRGA